MSAQIIKLSDTVAALIARVTPQDAVRWRDHMISRGITPKAVRDVWLAAPRSVATHMLNALKLEINPFAGIRVEGVKAWKEDDERGFDPDQALTILSATVAAPSHLISREMKAARGDSRKARPDSVTTAVYHRFDDSDRQSRPISRQSELRHLRRRPPASILNGWPNLRFARRSTSLDVGRYVPSLTLRSSMAVST